MNIIYKPCNHSECTTMVAEPIEYCSVHANTKEDSFKQLDDFIKHSFGEDSLIQKMWSKGLFKNNIREEEVDTNQTNTKEETLMNNTFKSVTGEVVEVAKEALRHVKGFVKKHLGKSIMGLAAITVAGTFTSGLGAALVVGSGLYAAVAYAIELIKSRKEKAQDRTQAVLKAIGEGMLYSMIGGMALYCLFAFVIGLLGNLFIYSYVGYIYMSYFLVA